MWKLSRTRIHTASPRSAEQIRRILRKGPRLAATARFCSRIFGAGVNRRRADAWRSCLRTYEIDEAREIVDELFKRSFGQMPPKEPRHFVLIYFPPQLAVDRHPCVIAYSHHRSFDDIYLGGGLCVDERAYRRFPTWLFDQVKAQGGLATIMARESVGMLGNSVACFGRVGEPRSRRANLRAGFVDTGRPHVMVLWQKSLSDDEKERLVRKVEAYGPF
jgi:hypothetical protein